MATICWRTTFCWFVLALLIDVRADQWNQPFHDSGQTCRSSSSGISSNPFEQTSDASAYRTLSDAVVDNNSVLYFVPDEHTVKALYLTPESAPPSGFISHSVAIPDKLGTIIWSTDLTSEDFCVRISPSSYSHAPIVDSELGLLYLHVLRNCSKKIRHHGMVALNSKSGDIVWSWFPQHDTDAILSQPVLKPVTSTLYFAGRTSFGLDSKPLTHRTVVVWALMCHSTSATTLWTFLDVDDSASPLLNSTASLDLPDVDLIPTASASQDSYDNIYLFNPFSKNFSCVSYNAQLLWSVKIPQRNIYQIVVRPDKNIVLNSGATSEMYNNKGKFVASLQDVQVIAVSDDNSMFGWKAFSGGKRQTYTVVVRLSADGRTQSWINYFYSDLFANTFGAITSDGVAYISYRESVIDTRHVSIVLAAINWQNGKFLWNFTWTAKNLAAGVGQPIINSDGRISLRVNNTNRLISCCHGHGTCSSEGCMCAEGWQWKPDCSAYCNQTMCQQIYNNTATCNDDGECVCFKNFYPANNCSIYCDSILCGNKNGFCTDMGICACNKNYYGEHCTNFCLARVTCNDNGYCNDHGECECHRGTGPFCHDRSWKVSLILILTSGLILFICAIVSFVVISKTNSYRSQYETLN